MATNNPASTAQRGRGPFAVLRRAKSVKNASETERGALLDDAERIETWAAWLVLGAIVLEAAVWASPLSPSLFKIGNFLADAAVAIGIYGEMRFGHVVGNVLKTLLAEATERATNAELELWRLRGAISIREGLVNDALLANAKALRDNALATVAGMVTSERIAVAHDFIDRGTMTEAARSLDATAKVQSFAGKQFDAVATSSDINLETLKRTLCSGLKAAGWVEVEPSNGCDREQSSIGGDGLVKIQFDASNLSALGAAAEGLASALNSVGIAAFVTSIAPCDASNATAIHIVVGAKAERL